MAASSPAGARVPGTTIASPPLDDVIFSRIYHDAARPLLSYVCRVTQDQALAEDIVQRAFFRFLQAEVPEMDQRETRQYLFRIASNLLADHWRKTTRETRLWSFLRPEHVEGTRETRLDVQKIFGQLKPREREMLWLAHVEGCTHQEVAEILELGEKSVRVLLFRARKKLQELLSAHGFDPEAAT